jgi:hypothetical protein
MFEILAADDALLMSTSEEIEQCKVSMRILQELYWQDHPAVVFYSSRDPKGSLKPAPLTLVCSHLQ